jgi:hypothetical protein
MKVDVHKISIEVVMNRRYMRFLFSEPTLDDCNNILKKFNADVRKVKRENKIYKTEL